MKPRLYFLALAATLATVLACSESPTSVPDTDTITPSDTPDVNTPDPDTNTIPPVSADPITRSMSATLNTPMLRAAGLVGGDDRIYVCDGAQVRALNAADLTDAGTATLQNPCEALARVGDHLIVSERNGDWVLLDTTNDLTETARLAGPNVFSFAVGANRIVGLAGTEGLALAPLDLSADVTGSTLATDARAGLFLADGSLLVADGFHGLKHIDLGTDGGPALLTSRETEGIAVGLNTLSDGHVAVAQAEWGVLIIDSADPELADVSDNQIAGMSMDLATIDGALIVAGWDAVRLLDIQDHTATELVAREFFFPGEASFGRVMAAEISGDSFVVAGTDHVTRLTTLTNAITPEFSPHQRVIQIEVLEGDAGGSTGALIYNTGKEELLITDLQSSDERIIICTSACGDPVEDVIAEPDGVTFFEIQTTTNESFEAYLTLKTNDPDFSEFTWPVRVNPTLLNDGSTAPDFVMPGINGEMVQLSQLKGNVIFIKLFNAQ